MMYSLYVFETMLSICSWDGANLCGGHLLDWPSPRPSRALAAKLEMGKVMAESSQKQIAYAGHVIVRFSPGPRQRHILWPPATVQ